MPQSLSSVYLHAVFSTKGREPFLAEATLRSELFAYMSEVSRRLDCPRLAIGGAEDHVHLLVRFARTITTADWIKEVKRVSSAFMKKDVRDFGWQAGYGVFSVES